MVIQCDGFFYWIHHWLGKNSQSVTLSDVGSLAIVWRFLQLAKQNHRIWISTKWYTSNNKIMNWKPFSPAIISSAKLHGNMRACIQQERRRSVTCFVTLDIFFHRILHTEPKKQYEIIHFVYIALHHFLFICVLWLLLVQQIKMFTQKHN